MITFFNEFYKNSIEPQIGNVDYTIINNHKCWFKTTSNEIILDVLGVNESGTLDQITLNDNLFIGGSSGSGSAETVLSVLLGLFHEYSSQELKYKELHCNEWSFLPSLMDFPHCESEARVDDPNAFIDSLKAIQIEMKSRQDKFTQKGVQDFKEYRKSGDMPAKIIVLDHAENLFRLERYARTRGKDGDDLAKLNGKAHEVLDSMSENEITSAKSEILSTLAQLMTEGSKYGYHFILMTDDIQYCDSKFVKDTCSLIGLKGTSPRISDEFIGSDLAKNIFGDRTRTIFRNGTKTPANVEDVFITPYIPTIGDDVNSFKHIKQEFFSHQYFS